MAITVQIPITTFLYALYYIFWLSDRFSSFFNTYINYKQLTSDHLSISTIHNKNNQPLSLSSWDVYQPAFAMYNPKRSLICLLDLESSIKLLLAMKPAYYRVVANASYSSANMMLPMWHCSYRAYYYSQLTIHKFTQLQDGAKALKESSNWCRGSTIQAGSGQSPDQNSGKKKK